MHKATTLQDNEKHVSQKEVCEWVENSNYQVSGKPAVVTCVEYMEHKCNNRRMNGDETASQINISHVNVPCKLA
jgi:hypothetical protein